MDDFNFNGKKVLVRVDLNSSYGADGKIIPSERFDAHLQTIRELSEKGARVVILAHQGRPGDKEFKPLSDHAQLLVSKLGKCIKFTEDVIGPSALYSIDALSDGEVLLLDNVRLLGEENLELTPVEHAKSIMVRRLASRVDFFVSDAFSNAHRKNASMLGFPVVLPNCAGRVMQREVESLKQVTTNAQRPVVYLLGGVKIDETFDLLEAKANKVDYFLTSGSIAYLFLTAKGVKLGEPNENEVDKFITPQYLERAKALLAQYGDKILTPIDFAVSVDGKRREYAITDFPVNYEIFDIGMRTVAKYAAVIKGSKSLLLKGVPGKFEYPGFEIGTKELCKVIAESQAFKLQAGGSYSSAYSKFNMDGKINYTSLAGGALLVYLTKGNLPGVDVLNSTD